MTLQLGLATVIGAAIFPFVVRMIWGEMVEKFGPIGGWLAATFIVGTIWALNHGSATPLIHQTGAWVDQGLAVGVGVLFASSLRGGKIKKAIPNIVAALLGGALAGLICYLVMA
ncbi:Lin0368 family putative glycerol transporter subunit [Vaginisenegalia massiliensis]|uniref:Lin0368 family putative glycerol transporter subunit n=1 Tax=Vaginisenegalia massiliensis TaxID=2058294 RepID=UPI000F5377B4|nr:hypothetical protein [Vaginisenegalia massiliensis]